MIESTKLKTGAETRSGSKSLLFPSAPVVPDDVKALYRDDKWTISNERVFMEDLVYKRLTLFLAVAAALTTGVVNLGCHFALSVPLLVLGTILCCAIQQTIHRAQLKLDVILQILFHDKQHPTGYVNAILKDGSRVRWFGYLVPTAVCVLLIILTIGETLALAGLVTIS